MSSSTEFVLIILYLASLVVAFTANDNREKLQIAFVILIPLMVVILAITTINDETSSDSPIAVVGGYLIVVGVLKFVGDFLRKKRDRKKNS